MFFAPEESRAGKSPEESWSAFSELCEKFGQSELPNQVRESGENYQSHPIVNQLTETQLQTVSNLLELHREKKLNQPIPEAVISPLLSRVLPDEDRPKDSRDRGLLSIAQGKGRCTITNSCLSDTSRRRRFPPGIKCP